VFKLAIPLLHVTDSVAAEDFYCDRLGFRLEFAHRPGEHAKAAHLLPIHLLPIPVIWA
jgi:catechol 2,3-dioxygenase-like lactoylglutathione lyase family enzyme